MSEAEEAHALLQAHIDNHYDGWNPIRRWLYERKLVQLAQLYLELQYREDHS